MDAAAALLEDVAQSAQPDELAAAILSRLRESVPEFFAEPDVAQDMTAAVAANVRRFGQLAARGETSDALPLEAEDLLQSTIQHGIPLISLLEAYRAAQGIAVSWWQDELERRARPPVARRATRVIHEVLLRYIDAAAAQIRTSYEHERQALESGVEARRAHLIRRLLAGEPLDAEAAARSLNHPLAANHVALVLWRTDDHDDDAFARTLAALAAAAGPARVLRLPAARHRCYAWLSSSAPLDVDRMAAVRACGPARAAISEVQLGLDGFVRAHRDAVRAAATVRESGRDPGDRVVRFEELELVTLLSSDPAQRDRFVRRLLGELADETAAAAKLRETLRVYLAAGSSPSRAAARLGVHRNTVAYRLQAAGDRLVPHEHPRRLELEVALRLHALGRVPTKPLRD